MANKPVIADGGKLSFAIDRGGTFTDIVCEFPTHPSLVEKFGPVTFRIMKLLSVNPGSYPDAPREAVRRLLEEVTGESYPIDKPLDTSRIQSVRMGTTVATNALLERKGERTVLVTTKGLKDILVIGNQSRPNIFDLKVARASPIVEAVAEADERVRVISHTAAAEVAAENNATSSSSSSSSSSSFDEGSSDPAGTFLGEPVSTATGVTGETVQILEPLNEEAIRSALAEHFKNGITSVAVALAHSYTFRKHEARVAEIAKELGFQHVSLSAELMPAVKLVPRAFTACADAYLTPCINRYLTQFLAGFDSKFLDRCQLLFMQSDGGLTAINTFTGFRAVLSGPAGGVVGYSRTSYVEPTDTRDHDGDDHNHSSHDGRDENGVEDADDADTISQQHSANTKAAASSRSRRVRRRPGDLVIGQPVIGFDMGGTSTDVSRYDGELDHIFENTTAGVTIQAPQLDINTVAAGGGSILTFTAGMFNVGPESASAYPGPACYRRGGPATVTDANLVLGRVQAQFFPRVFGAPRQDQPLDEAASRAVLSALAAQVNGYAEASSSTPASSPTTMSVEDVALGFIAVANEAMCRPIRALTEARGFDVSRHTLACFGAAGGQHACVVAEALGISRVHVHRFSGVLSAYGMGLADVVVERQHPSSMYLRAEGAVVDAVLRARELCDITTAELKEQGFANDAIHPEIYLGLRYEGTDTSIMLRVPSKLAAVIAARRADEDSAPLSASAETDFVAQLTEVFERRYRREFGFTLARAIVLDTVRVRAVGSHAPAIVPTSSEHTQTSGGASGSGQDSDEAARPPPPSHVVKAYFPKTSGTASTSSSSSSTSASSAASKGEWRDTPAYTLPSLRAHTAIAGPALIIDVTATIVVDPMWTAYITEDGSVSMVRTTSTTAAEDSSSSASSVASATSTTSGEEDVDIQTLLDAYPCDPVQLSVFSHRFMSIAEQMGRALQRTSVSTNIKERLDFSCALFGPDGGLVANAPHLPVHLGAMQEAVRSQIRLIAGDWADGDVVVSNHPQAGGSHLPDITVITPVFASPTASSPAFFVASRGHHADIGGISPGSMPPFSKYLYQEGAAIMSFKLVRKGGTFDQQGITDLLNSPAGFARRSPDEPACVGTRNLADNLSDLRAQVAANQKGVQLMQGLIASYGLRVVQAYMAHIQRAAEAAVREMLTTYSLSQGLPEVAQLPTVEDFMDDGSVIRLAVTISRRDGSAVFDFTGTSPQVHGNTNAPRAVTYSAVIYCLRCLVQRSIPLNQGCLTPVRVIIPSNTILNPSPDAAVVGGNVLTSQRVTDVVLKAFNAAAASQGCMNNLTFGDSTFGYYETIAGGAGAGPSWEGTSGVHTHMTNTRITDVEIIERRYPVLIRKFHLRPNSGGAGRNRGGDGVVREIQFLRPLTINILSERRICQPFGLSGGGPAARGQNFIVKYRGPVAAASRSSEGDDDNKSSDSCSEQELVINLGGKNTYYADQGDAIRILSPGGGGWGVPPPTSSSGSASTLTLSSPPQSTSTSSSTLPATFGSGSVAQYIMNQESA